MCDLSCNPISLVVFMQKCIFVSVSCKHISIRALSFLSVISILCGKYFIDHFFQFGEHYLSSLGDFSSKLENLVPIGTSLAIGYTKSVHCQTQLHVANLLLKSVKVLLVLIRVNI